jgi:hypothetical protein
MLDQWIVYCRENETKIIPKAVGKLSRWVHDQRKAWKKLLTKQKTTMTTERVRVLSDAGFLFDPTTTTAGDDISTSKKATANNKKKSVPMPTPTSAKGKAKALRKKTDTSAPMTTPKAAKGKNKAPKKNRHRYFNVNTKSNKT